MQNQRFMFTVCSCSCPYHDNMLKSRDMAQPFSSFLLAEQSLYSCCWFCCCNWSLLQVSDHQICMEQASLQDEANHGCDGNHRSVQWLRASGRLVQILAGTNPANFSSELAILGKTRQASACWSAWFWRARSKSSRQNFPMRVPVLHSPAWRVNPLITSRAQVKEGEGHLMNPFT